MSAGVFASDAGGSGGGARRARERGRPDAAGRAGAFVGRGFGSAVSGSSSVDERGRLSLLSRVTMDLGADDVVVTGGSGNTEGSASPGRGSRDVDRCISSSGRSKQRIRVRIVSSYLNICWLPKVSAVACRNSWPKRRVGDQAWNTKRVTGRTLKILRNLGVKVMRQAQKMHAVRTLYEVLRTARKGP